MSPESYRPIFASHSSASSISSFIKHKLGLHVEESACNKYQNFTVNPQEGRNGGRIHGVVIDFSLKVNFDDMMLSQFLQKILRLRSNSPTLLVQHHVDFIFVKQEQSSRGRKQ